jgi:glutamate carboxypeptidase
MFEALGCTTSLAHGKKLGPCLIARRAGAGRGRILLIGHMDTVYKQGTVQAHPFAIDGARVRGPGVCDMKSGLLVGMSALRFLDQQGSIPCEELTFLYNSDEEIGSPESRALMITLARQADAVLVLEPAPEGHADCVTVGRKGLLNVSLTVTGRASHAGVDPDAGRNAILELAHHIIAIQALNNTVEGVTLNVGVVEGGERSNVVPAQARAKIDVRTPSAQAMRKIQKTLREEARQRHVEDTVVRQRQVVIDHPFEQTAASRRLFDLARTVAGEFGLTLRGVTTGGASDANTAAEHGTPVLDGLGLAGGGEHNAEQEYVETSSIAPRIVLLAGLLGQLSEITSLNGEPAPQAALTRDGAKRENA